MDFLTDVSFWRQAITVGCFGLFLWICKWAYSSKRHQEFEEINAHLMNNGDEAVGRLNNE